MNIQHTTTPKALLTTLTEEDFVDPNAKEVDYETVLKSLDGNVKSVAFCYSV